MNKQKGSVLLIILFLLAGAGLVLVGYKYAFKPKVQPTIIPSAYPLKTADPTLDWKTYTNPQNKYSFKYPSILTLVSDQSWLYDSIRLDFNPGITSATPTTSPKNSLPKTKINTGTTNNAQTLLSIIEITDTGDTAEKYINDIYTSETKDKSPSTTFSPIKTTTISNKKAYYFEETNSQRKKEIFVDLDKDTILRIITGVSEKIGGLTGNQTDSLIDQILSTFQFLN